MGYFYVAKVFKMQNEKEIGIIVKMLSNEIGRCLSKEFCSDELTHMQRRIISYLHVHSSEDIFQKNIETTFNIRRSTATGILKLMEKNGLIRRTAVAGDARLKKIVLTHTANEIYLTTKYAIENLEKAMRQGIHTEDLKIFCSVAEQIHQNLKNFQISSKKGDLL